jgi:succinate dehydrogenase / fumarate reductase membrane anchor subunit
MAMTMRTPLSRVLYLGAGHGGTDAFWRSRITGAGILLASLVCGWAIIAALGKPQAEVAAIIGSPLVAAAFVLLIGAAAIHMRLGMREIIEDYVHDEGLKILAFVANTFFAAVVGAVGIIAVLKLAVGA